ncbi:immune inhibitor A [Luteolibacter arcticus]|uniref:Immune inhibitor A n=1 Tax=Luteolibacter arcticus TaxID=1581411 RepID=A0ABT3GQ91_9BACT|nr:immune inhibitor A [Luteolibacter arcticus]
MAIFAAWLSMLTLPSLGGVLWSEKFDDAGAAGRWQAGGDWEIGPVTGGPGNAVSASGVAATGLAAGAIPAITRRIASVGSITIPVSSVSPRLRFRQWHRFSSGSIGRIQVRQVGAEWINLEGASVSGQSTGWEWVCMALDDHSGQSIEIGFLCETGAAAAAPGWYLDDVEVVDGPESDYAAWRAGYFPGAYPDLTKEAAVWGG